MVSQWSDQSGNNRHLLQATGTNQPALQSDGSILFDGVDNFMKCTAFTLVQPETVYILMKQVGWTNDTYFFNGNAIGTGGLQQITSSPLFRPIAAAANGNNGDLAIGVYGVVSTVLNGASSLTQVNNNASVTANVSTGDMGGFTLADRSGAGANAANIQVKEVIVYPTAHDAATRAAVVSYLAAVGGLSV